MRDGFREIISGWTLVKDVEALGERIEAAAEWKKNNGLEADEEATVKMMVEVQIVWGIERGDFEPYLYSEYDPADCEEDDLD